MTDRADVTFVSGRWYLNCPAKDCPKALLTLWGIRKHLAKIHNRQLRLALGPKETEPAS